MPDSRQRMTARRVTIHDIINGSYHQREGFDPNFLITPKGMRVSRASVVATVVDTFVNDDESYGAFTLDDGTETIRAKFFQELDDMENIEEGDIVHVIGKIREYDSELYIQPELITPKSISFELLHDLETERMARRWNQAVEKAEELQQDDKDEEDIRHELKGIGITKDEDIEAILTHLNDDGSEQKATFSESTASPNNRDDEEQDNKEQLVLHAIDELDEGDGADYGEIIETVDMGEEAIEDVINDLLSDGTCYEPKPGRIKKL